MIKIFKYLLGNSGENVDQLCNINLKTHHETVNITVRLPKHLYRNSAVKNWGIVISPTGKNVSVSQNLMLTNLCEMQHPAC